MKFPDRRRTLRQRTAAAHEELEALVGPFEIPAAYVKYCRGLYAFRAALEPALAAITHAAVCGDWRPVTIASDLAADLADVHASPIAPPRIAFASAYEAIGGCYVLEGSALGARVLVTRAHALGFTATHGARHLAHQAASLNNWRAFLGLLESMPQLDIDAAVNGANMSFQAAADAMTRACSDG